MKPLINTNLHKVKFLILAVLMTAGTAFSYTIPPRDSNSPYIVHVDSRYGNDDNPGWQPGLPKASIEDAINDSADGNTIVIWRGTGIYTTSTLITISGKRLSLIGGTKNVYWNGGGDFDLLTTDSSITLLNLNIDNGGCCAYGLNFSGLNSYVDIEDCNIAVVHYKAMAANDIKEFYAKNTIISGEGGVYINGADRVFLFNVSTGPSKDGTVDGYNFYFADINSLHIDSSTFLIKGSNYLPIFTGVKSATLNKVNFISLDRTGGTGHVSKIITLAGGSYLFDNILISQNKNNTTNGDCWSAVHLQNGYRTTLNLSNSVIDCNLNSAFTGILSAIEVNDVNATINIKSSIIRTQREGVDYPGFYDIRKLAGTVMVSDTIYNQSKTSGTIIDRNYAIQQKTDNLPANPASATDVSSADANIIAAVAATDTNVIAAIAATDTNFMAAVAAADANIISGLAETDSNIIIAVAATDANIIAEVADIDTNSVTLSASGLDNIPTTDPDGVADTWPQMSVQVWRRFFKRVVRDADGDDPNYGYIYTYNDSDEIATTQAYGLDANDLSQQYVGNAE